MSENRPDTCRKASCDSVFRRIKKSKTTRHSHLCSFGNSGNIQRKIENSHVRRLSEIELKHPNKSCVKYLYWSCVDINEYDNGNEM
jgi:hypothetical protein